MKMTLWFINNLHGKTTTGKEEAQKRKAPEGRARRVVHEIMGAGKIKTATLEKDNYYTWNCPYSRSEVIHRSPDRLSEPTLSSSLEFNTCESDKSTLFTLGLNTWKFALIWSKNLKTKARRGFAQDSIRGGLEERRSITESANQRMTPDDGDAEKRKSKSRQESVNTNSRLMDFNRDLMAAAVVGGVVHTVVAPIERTKLLLQTQESNMAIVANGRRKFKGMLDCIVRTVREEGFLSLWRGNGSSVLRYYPSVALNFSLKVCFLLLSFQYSSRVYWQENVTCVYFVCGFISFLVIHRLVSSCCLTHYYVADSPICWGRALAFLEF